jgi:two-component system, NarL family, sensor kinase
MAPMRLKSLLLLLAVGPLLLAVVAVAWVVQLRLEHLAAWQAQRVSAIIEQARRDEIQHFVEAGVRAIAAQRRRGANDASARQEALEFLRGLDFGDDNYFFVYDYQGVNLMHARQPANEGQNLWNHRDADGKLVIQELVAAARAGGGFVDYGWMRPSTGRAERKLGYAMPVPEFGWMVGTGLYLDPLAQSVAVIQQASAAAVRDVRDEILWIALGALALVAAGGTALTLVEQRRADSKLRALAQQVVRSQEAERRRVAQELHDGVSQSLASLKFVLESAVLRLGRGEQAALQTVQHSVEQLRDVMRDVRRISHGLRPTLLDDLGLAAAVEQVAREFAQRTGLAVHTEITPPEGLPDLPEALAISALRLTQEALTNVERHAQARQVDIGLHWVRGELRLTVDDNGRGFDVDAIQRHPRTGLGLTSMRERVETLDGTFTLGSTPAGTRLEARWPATP